MEWDYLDDEYLRIFGEHPDVGKHVAQPVTKQRRTRSRRPLGNNHPDLRILPSDPTRPQPTTANRPI